jgi:hypothetical protein
MNRESFRIMMETGIGLSAFKAAIEMQKMREKHKKNREDMHRLHQEVINERSRRRFTCNAEDAEFEEV